MDKNICLFKILKKCNYNELCNNCYIFFVFLEINNNNTYFKYRVENNNYFYRICSKIKR